MVSIDDYIEVKDCIYKDEHYSVRDNGAIMRHQRIGMRKRKLDNVWSWGLPNDSGYNEFCGERVHRIVATAFHGPAPSEQHVVDHIDTNRRNNRPENLRWLTRLENALNNPITRAKIENICGSIESFLADPSILQGHERVEHNFSWMRAVSPEEARSSLERLTSWAKEHPKPKGGSLGEWIFNSTSQYDMGSPQKMSKGNNGSTTPIEGDLFAETETIICDDEIRIEDYDKDTDCEDKSNDDYEWNESLTPSAMQSWWTKTEFPCCPDEVTDDGLEIYFENIKEGCVFSQNSFGSFYVIVSKFVVERNILFVLSNTDKEYFLGTFSLVAVEINKGKFCHFSMKRFDEKETALHFFKLVIGEEEWTSEDDMIWDT